MLAIEYRRGEQRAQCDFGSRGPVNGSLTLNANGTFSYTHNGSETTTDSFTYRANDGTANSLVTTVLIAVMPVNDERRRWRRWRPRPTPTRPATTPSRPLSGTLDGNDIDNDPDLRHQRRDDRRQHQYRRHGL